MAWLRLNLHKLRKHPKTLSFRRKFNWPAHQALGFLCAFLSEVSELSEDGNISSWTPDDLTETVGIGNVNPSELWEALVEGGFIERRDDGRYFVQDWLEMAGPYLMQKYHARNRQKLVYIWSLYGLVYGRESKTAKTTSDPESLDESDPAIDLSIDPSIELSIDAKKRGISPPDAIPPHPPSSEEEKGTVFNTRDKDVLKTAPRGGGKVFNSAPPAEKRRETNPEIRELLESMKRRLDIVNDEPTTFSWPVWGNFVKRLVTDQYFPAEIDRRFNHWITSTDPFTRSNLNNGGMFYNRFNSLKDGPILQSNQGSTNGHSRNYGYDTITREEAERRFG